MVMANDQGIENNSWPLIQRFLKHPLSFIIVGANLAGAAMVTFYFMFINHGQDLSSSQNGLLVIGIMFVGLVFIATIFLRRWLKDLNRFVDLKIYTQAIDSNLLTKAQQKILNLPCVCALTSLFNWFLAANITAIYFSIGLIEGSSADRYFDGVRIFIGVIIAGIVTCAIVFFSVEKSCRKYWLFFFPDGGLIKTPAVFRLKLHVRMLTIFGLVSVLPIILMSVLSYNKARMMLELPPQEVLGSLLSLTAFLVVAALVTTVFLSRSFSNSIIAPVRRMEKAMAKVESGDFTAVLPVDSNDELGALADHFNQMTEGLKERYRLRQSLDLAKEVQQNLLPNTDPIVKGLDIAGKSIYCDETGGDYYDFIPIGDNDEQRIGVAVGDVSGHGISSALLMATVRSALRQRASRTGDPATIICDLNRQLVMDVEDSGQFITMLFLVLDATTKKLEWVRAGHDPGILYDPGTDTFSELGGSGLALGVDAQWVYEGNQKTDFTDGQIVFIGTDGIWEARNKNGDMLGKTPIENVIRQNATKSAAEIIDAIVDATYQFSGELKIEDDITSVIIKSRV